VKTLHTRQSTVGRLLDEQKIPFGEHDRINVDPASKIKNGDSIDIVYTQPVELTADGQTRTLYTTGKTVQSALADLNISLGPEDKITPALDSGLSGPIKIVRVKKEMEEQTQPIAFDTVKKNDSTLLKGREQTVQEGKEGSKLIRTEKVYEDGQLVSENVVEEKVQEESVKKIVAVGTKVTVTSLSSSSPTIEEVTKNGMSFGYKSIINNMTLTAYTGGGTTYTGTKTVEGQTIAVDKNVIPLGWWVYIEGIGLRRAEDTGSAIKGNMIDVYYNDPNYATKFGIKRGYTVYVIGPKKPASE
jgi:3D (Asp-Asp-Asp) domain-containing protein